MSIDDESITFVHQNESLQYKLSISDISKIEFASGRSRSITLSNHLFKVVMEQIQLIKRMPIYSK